MSYQKERIALGLGCAKTHASRPPLKENQMGLADEVKARVTTRQLCAHVGLTVDRQGFALCPFHGDGNKSLKVYADSNRGWTCFGCHRGGTVIDFAMNWYGIDFQQAIVRLDSDFGLGLPLQRKMSKTERIAARQERRRIEKQKADAQNAFFMAESSFAKLHDQYCLLLTTSERECPKRPSDAISVLYAEALQLLPIIKNDFDKALYDLENARREVELIGTTRTDAPA